MAGWFFERTPELKRVALLSLIFFALFGFGSMARGEEGLSESEKTKLLPIRYGIEALNENAKEKIITTEQMQLGIARYLTEAEGLIGKKVNLSDIISIEAMPQKELTALQKFAGLITFVNILWVIAIFVGVISGTYLFGDLITELLALFVNIPLEFYEYLLYSGSLALLYFGTTFKPEIAPYVGFTGCLALGGAMHLSMFIREGRIKEYKIFSVLFIIWATAALMYESSLIGFAAVVALMGALGFSAVMYPGCIAIGFEDDSAIGRATAAAFVILATFVGMRSDWLPYSDKLKIFEGGALFMGSFVGYLGLLIASSRWYNGRGYWHLQITTIVAGLVAIGVGSIYGIGELQKIGGTFFVIYLLEKLFEIPVNSRREYATLGLIVSGVLYAIAMAVKSHPETLGKYVFMFQ